MVEEFKFDVELLSECQLSAAKFGFLAFQLPGKLVAAAPFRQASQTAGVGLVARWLQGFRNWFIRAGFAAAAVAGSEGAADA